VLSPVCGVQAGTPVAGVRAVLQVTPWPLPFGPLGVQLPTLVGVPASVLQYVAVKPLPALAATGVHDATSLHTGAAGLVVQVVAV
jgi:hypothetical protein